MLKGCQRRIIMVKDTGSRYFDSAYFVIKQDLPQNAASTDMLAEAHRMIDAYTKNGDAGLVHTQVVLPDNAAVSKKWGRFPVLTGILLSVASASLTVAAMLIFI